MAKAGTRGVRQACLPPDCRGLSEIFGLRPGDHGGSFAHFGVRNPQLLGDSVGIKKVVGGASCREHPVVAITSLSFACLPRLAVRDGALQNLVAIGAIAGHRASRTTHVEF
jgi:hypothetical protein